MTFGEAMDMMPDAMVIPMMVSVGLFCAYVFVDIFDGPKRLKYALLGIALLVIVIGSFISVILAVTT